ncbi:hypothetical protein [uncultured Bradyrhizobium sp.]|uniref:hypothetical protein n=1 Tax=uncultured Bradyrhizobium sp. TaxID=199684 RepID=UPI0035CA493A
MTGIGTNGPELGSGQRTGKIVIVGSALTVLIIGIFLDPILVLIVLPFALVATSYFSHFAGWPLLQKICALVAAVIPIVLASVIFFRTGKFPFLPLLLTSLISWGCGVLAYKPEILQHFTGKLAFAMKALLFREDQSKTASGSRNNFTHHITSPKLDPNPSYRPVFANTSRHAIEGVGTVFSVSWTDFSQLRFADRYHLLPISLVSSGYALVVGLPSAMYFGITMQSVFIAIIVATIGLWTYKFVHERYRFSSRSISFFPDGSISFRNPPSYQAGRTVNGKDFNI